MSVPLPPLPELNLISGIPLHQQVARFYRAKIQSGEISPGVRLPTCSELGKSLCLAPNTIHQAFKLLADERLVHRRRSLGTIVGSGPLSIDSPAHRLHYRALPVSTILRKKNFSTDGELVVIQDYLKGLMEGFNAWKCRFEVNYLEEDQPDLELVQALVEGNHCRGLVNFGLADDATEYLLANRFPMVMINRDLSGQGIPSVVADNVRGYGEAWKRVQALGHRMVAYLAVARDSPSVRLQECMAGRELTNIDSELDQVIRVSIAPEPEEIWAAIETYWGTLPTRNSWPTLFFAQTDILAASLIRALHHHRIQVPRDVSVIGFDDLSIAGFFSPGITTLNKPRTKMAFEAAQLLLELIHKKPPNGEALRVFPVHLVERETLASPRTETAITVQLQESA